MIAPGRRSTPPSHCRIGAAWGDTGTVKSGFQHTTAIIGDHPNGLTHADIPISPKYFEGFRSLGTERGSAKSDDRPAWLQDLDGTTEREGRAQDKEDLMERLRDLGYM